MGDPTQQFCPDCGTLLEGLVSRDEADRKIDQLESIVADLSRDHIEDLRALGNMKRRLEDESPGVTGQDDAVFNAWCEATGRDPAKMKFGEGRQRAIKRMRRAGYSQDQIFLAVELAGRYRYLVFGRWSATGSASDRKDDLIDIFKDEKRIESLLACGERDDG